MRDTKRAFALTQALASIDADNWRAMIEREKVAESWEYRGLRIGIGDLGFGGGGDFDCCNIQGWADVDIVTGRKLLAAMRAIIVAELRELGVEAA